MAQLAVASIVFIALHILPALKFREWLVKQIGDPAYMGLFSLASVLGLAWMIYAYQAAPAGDPLWITGPAIRWATAVLMLFPFIFVVCGTTTKNPTSVMGKGALKDHQKWTDIFAITRHPVMWAIIVWATLHLINRPEMRSLLFFGAMGLLGLAGSVRQEVRKHKELGPAWEKFVSQTSHVPFLAILSGRARLRLADLGGWRIVTAVLLWLATLYLHSHILGVSPLAVLT
ncbi:MAG: NnrU family protein [Hyphomicrobiaceae bacterium]|nr:NnrU family protein [Hyphomicrobiaceae bacterium]